MRKSVWLAIVGAVCLGYGQASADQTVKGECLISVKGRTYLDGPCPILLQPGGSFQAGNGRGGTYFATVDVDGATGTARANWNGRNAESHAHDPLGTMKRDAGCWSNASAKVCAWRAGTRPRVDAPSLPVGAAVSWTAGRKIDVPIVIGGSTKFDACVGAGHVIGLDPKGDGFLSVQSGPGGKPFTELDRLHNGSEVVICDEQGPWFGVVYGPPGTDCNTGMPWPTRQAYTGPCKAGWIHRKYVRITVG